jgi:REP element-mobilizing transposase RayT
MPRPYKTARTRENAVGGYDLTKHRRRSIRIPGFDYASPGAYFVTICVHGGECLLGEVAGGQMRLNRLGRIAQAGWQAIPAHSVHVELDAFVVMPNHVHGIVVITGRGVASPGAGSRDAMPLQGPATGSLGAIVGNWKAVTTRRINRLRNFPGVPFWQRNYWEHVIRSGAALGRIRAYIEANPACWSEDTLRPGEPAGRTGRA